LSPAHTGLSTARSATHALVAVAAVLVVVQGVDAVGIAALDEPGLARDTLPTPTRTVPLALV
jgi:hypothetical protein